MRFDTIRRLIEARAEHRERMIEWTLLKDQSTEETAAELSALISDEIVKILRVMNRMNDRMISEIRADYDGNARTLAANFGEVTTKYHSAVESMASAIGRLDPHGNQRLAELMTEVLVMLNGQGRI